MIKRWFISRLEVLRNKERSERSFCGKFMLNEKVLTLYNKGNNKNYSFLYPKAACDRLGYWVSRNKIPNYFKNVFKTLDCLKGEDK